MLKVIADKSQILASMHVISRAVSSRSTQPILSNALLETSAGSLGFTATDLEIGLRTSIEAVVEDGGSVAVPARIMTDIIANMPSGKIELYQEKDNELLIKQGKSKYSVRTLPASEYPLFPELESGDICRLPADALQKALKQTLFATSQDETRPVLTGVFMELDNKMVSLAATDGHRLAVRRISFSEADSDSISIIIPGRAMSELIRVISGEEDVIIRMLSNQVAFISSGLVLVSRIIEGNYPNYRQVVPANLPQKVVVAREEMIKAVKGAYIMAREGSNVIRVKIGDGSLIIMAATQDIGNVEEEIEVAYAGEEMEIAFNARYLLDVMSAVDEDMIEIQFAGSLSPALIRPLEDEDYTYVVMPVKMG